MAEWRGPSAEGPATRWRKGPGGSNCGGDPGGGNPGTGNPGRGKARFFCIKNTFLFPYWLKTQLFNFWTSYKVVYSESSNFISLGFGPVSFSLYIYIYIYICIYVNLGGGNPGGALAGDY